MSKIVCSICGRSEDGTPDSDYICSNCQEKINIPAYQSEIKMLEDLGSAATASQKIRIEFLKSKIDAVK
jgi:tRNA(Ile2) C34 agmatinyltransferase TiaS